MAYTGRPVILFWFRISILPGARLGPMIFGTRRMHPCRRYFSLVFFLSLLAPAGGIKRWSCKAQEALAFFGRNVNSALALVQAGEHWWKLVQQGSYSEGRKEQPHQWPDFACLQLVCVCGAVPPFVDCGHRLGWGVGRHVQGT